MTVHIGTAITTLTKRSRSAYHPRRPHPGLGRIRPGRRCPFLFSLRVHALRLADDLHEHIRSVVRRATGPTDEPGRRVPHNHSKSTATSEHHSKGNTLNKKILSGIAAGALVLGLAACAPTPVVAPVAASAK